MTPLAQILYQEIDKIPIFDIHTHIKHHTPFARHLLDLLGYHYYTELSHSATFTKRWTDENLSPDEKAEELIKILPQIANTVQYSWLIHLSQEFFGFTESELTLKNWSSLTQTIVEKTKEPDYFSSLLKKSRIEKIFLTNSFDEKLEEIDREIFVPCLRADGFIEMVDRPPLLRKLETKVNISIETLTNLEEAIQKIYQYFKTQGAVSAMISLEPNFQTMKVEKTKAEGIFERWVKKQPLGKNELGELKAYLLNILAQNCEEMNFPFHLMLGAVERYYQHGVKSGDAVFDPLTSMFPLKYLFNTYPRVKFLVSTLPNTENLELATYGWILHNVFPAGHWWYAGNPVEIKENVKRRLLVVPRTKLIGYYSDAYKVEFILPKMRMYKWTLAQVLAELIEEASAGPGKGLMTEQKAIEIAKLLLYENPRRILMSKEKNK
jgi:glucuronate isomerase